MRIWWSGLLEKFACSWLYSHFLVAILLRGPLITVIVQSGGRAPGNMSVLARVLSGVPSAGLRPLAGVCAAMATSLRVC